jgi:hypothetical protein
VFDIDGFKRIDNVMDRSRYVYLYLLAVCDDIPRLESFYGNPNVRSIEYITYYNPDNMSIYNYFYVGSWAEKCPEFCNAIKKYNLCNDTNALRYITSRSSLNWKSKLNQVIQWVEYKRTPLDKIDFERIDNILDRALYFHVHVQTAIDERLHWEFPISKRIDRIDIDRVENEIVSQIAQKLGIREYEKRDYYRIGLWAQFTTSGISEFTIPKFYTAIKKYNLENDFDAMRDIIYHSGKRWFARLKHVVSKKKNTSKKIEYKMTELDYQNILYKQLNTYGYDVCKEKCISGCGYIDLVASKPGVTLIIEVKPNAHYDNVRKAFGQVVDYEQCFIDHIKLEKNHRVVKVIATPDLPKDRLLKMMRAHGIEHMLINRDG